MITNNDVKLAQQGNIEFIEKIFYYYKNLILKNNHNFFIKGAELDDLLQEGYVGLIKALKSYNESKNASFKTFANLCIRRQIITAMKTQNSSKYKNIHLAITENDYSKIEEVMIYNVSYKNIFDPEDTLLGKELAKQLSIFLENNLSVLEKKVFYYLNKEYSYLEIANVTNETPKKIDNTIQRIRKKVLKFVNR